jgi:hypothetical protein
VSRVTGRAKYILDDRVLTLNFIDIPPPDTTCLESQHTYKRNAVTTYQFRDCDSDKRSRGITHWNSAISLKYKIEQLSADTLAIARKRSQEIFVKVHKRP